jgi:roadblock/LC7 domain-containing protein
MKVRGVLVCCFISLILIACQGTSGPSQPGSMTPLQDVGEGEEGTLGPEETESTPDLSQAVESQIPLPPTPQGSEPDHTSIATGHPLRVTPSAPGELSFSSEGPYLTYLERVDPDTYALVMIDAYGLGHERVILPIDVDTLEIPRNGVSPDGRYYAFYEGALRSGGLTLALFNMQEKRVDLHIPILPTNYETRLDELAADLFANPPDELINYTAERLAEELRFSMLSGITARAWSPDGTLLAFAGQIDGLSSDLYVLDVETFQIKRLTDGRSNIQEISWSPDGKWILHGSAYRVGVGNYLTNHLVSADGSRVVSFPALEGQLWHDWVSPNLFILSESANGPGNYDLKVIDLSSMEVRGLWRSSYSDFAFSPERWLLLVSHIPSFEGDPPPGLYLSRMGGTEGELIQEGVFWELDFLGLDDFPFIAVKETVGTNLVSPEGGLKQIDDQIHEVLPSPDKHFIALYDLRDSIGLSIYDVGNDEVYDVYREWVGLPIWRDDSRVLFFFSAGGLNFYNLETQELIQVLQDVELGAVLDTIVWVQP